MTGAELIATERERQQAVEGFDSGHDDAHEKEELLYAAVCYAMHGNHPGGTVPVDWPWDDSWWKPTHDPIRALAKAGALIAAEIDRLQRLPPEE